MVSIDSIAVFVPILFLLVVELANIARDAIPADTIAEQNRSPIEILGRGTALGFELVPNLGRLFFIHLSGWILLSLNLLVILNFTSGLVSAGLTTGTAILLYFYPFIEVEEYDTLLTDGDIPDSYTNHLVHVTVLVSLTLGMGAFH